MILPLFQIPVDYQTAYQFENEIMPKIKHTMNQNLNDFQIYPQFQYPQQVVNYDIIVDQKLKNQIKKSKKSQMIKKKYFLKLKYNNKNLKMQTFILYPFTIQNGISCLTSIFICKINIGQLITQIIIWFKLDFKIQQKSSNQKGKKRKYQYWSLVNIQLMLISYHNEDIMNSSIMKKTSKIFKQMSELIGISTPSQCRSHHKKFNFYVHRGENGKRLSRNDKSRAGGKKKNQFLQFNKDANSYSIDQNNYLSKILIIKYLINNFTIIHN